MTAIVCAYYFPCLSGSHFLIHTVLRNVDIILSVIYLNIIRVSLPIFYVFGVTA